MAVDTFARGGLPWHRTRIWAGVLVSLLGAAGACGDDAGVDDSAGPDAAADADGGADAADAADAAAALDTTAATETGDTDPSGLETEALVEGLWEEWGELPEIALDYLDVASLIWGGAGLGRFEVQGEAPVTETGADWEARAGADLIRYELDEAGRRKIQQTGNVGTPACSVGVTGATVTVDGLTGQLGATSFENGTKSYTFAARAGFDSVSVEARWQAILDAGPVDLSPDEMAMRCGSGAPSQRFDNFEVFSVGEKFSLALLRREGAETLEGRSSVRSGFFLADRHTRGCCSEGVIWQNRLAGSATITEADYDTEESRWDGSWTTCSWLVGSDCGDPCSGPDCLEGLCQDGRDNDGDGDTDCDDSDCDGARCGEDICDDGEDNDDNGHIDCDDPNCAGRSCGESCTCAGEEACDDGVDNDGDGQVDCADSVCDLEACGTGCQCSGGEAHETLCDDSGDNDGDGLTNCEDGADCNDRSCGTELVCRGGVCRPAQLIGSVTPADGAVDVALDTTVEAVANEALDTDFVAVDTIGLAHAVPVSGTTEYIDAERRLRFQPDQALPLATEHTASLSGTVRAVGGDPLGDDLTWTFTTRDGDWSPVDPLTSTADLCQRVSVGSDAEGNAIGVWHGLDNVDVDQIQAAHYFNGEPDWDPATSLDNGAAETRKPRLAVAANGSAVAVWEQSYLVYGSQFDPDGGWSAADTPLQPSGVVDSFDVAIDDNGNAVVVWVSEEDDSISSREYYTASFVETPGWTDPTVVAEPTGTAEVAAGAAGQGRLFVAWSDQATGAAADVLVRTRTASDVWSEPARLAGGGVPSVEASNLRLMGAPDGSAVLVWARDEEIAALWAHVLMTSWFDPDVGAWSASEEIGTAPIGVNGLDIYVGPTGDAIVVWGDDGAIKASYRDAELETWTAPETVPAPANSYSPQVVLGPSGNAIAVWEVEAGGSWSIESAERIKHSETWVEGSVLGDGWHPSIAALPGGRAVSLFCEPTGVTPNTAFFE